MAINYNNKFKINCVWFSSSGRKSEFLIKGDFRIRFDPFYFVTYGYGTVSK